MDEKDVVISLAALAQPSRLQVFRALVVAGPQGLTPGALSELLGIAPTSLSFHLKELTHSGLISQERDGRNLIYRAEFSRMDSLLGYLTENCCQGEACLPAGVTACCQGRHDRPDGRREGGEFVARQV